MRAMVLEVPGAGLRLADVARPDPGAGQVLVRVAACGVCRTDLHILDGELPRPKMPLILGHEVVGTVVAAGDADGQPLIGRRIGIPWLGWTCGACDFCRRGEENLCPRARFTGYDIDGGYAEYTVADARYCLPIPDAYGDAEAAPLLCAGLIGYRCLRMAGPAQTLGLYGFGAAAHVLAQVARHRGQRVFAFVRPGDTAGERFAVGMGAAWAGPSTAPAPEPLDAAIIFAPVGDLVPLALAAVRPGGVVVCGGIHMSAIPRFDYSLLWGERQLRSVANLTRQDGIELLQMAPEIPVQTRIEELPLSEAGAALSRIRGGDVEGALVVRATEPTTGHSRD